VDDLRRTGPTGANDSQGMVLQRGQPVYAAIDQMDLDPTAGVADPADGLDYLAFFLCVQHFVEVQPCPH
ncbi:MAG: hypothetical protein QF435_11055, partial [Arenicellales bacterium]|nr:hypothetical protein [Arenicellales bacterium]